MKQPSGKAANSGLLRKTSGLTVVEISISLLLSGIIIGLAVLLYLNFRQSILIKEKQNQQSIDLIRNLHLIKDRFYYSKLAIYDSDNKIALYSSQNKETAIRIFDESLILENDTLFFHELEINISENDAGLIESMELTYEFAGEKNQVLLVKQYDNEIIFNRNFDQHGNSQH